MHILYIYNIVHPHISFGEVASNTQLLVLLWYFIIVMFEFHLVYLPVSANIIL